MSSTNKETGFSRWGLHCKWGKWAEVVAEESPAALTEGHNITTGLLSHARGASSSSSSSSSSPNVEMDPKLWGELQDHIDLEEMVFAKLPFHAFYRALSVCKKWNSLKKNKKFMARLNTDTSPLLPKPYFVIHGNRQACHQAMLMQDTGKWVLKALPSNCAGFPFPAPAPPSIRFHVASGMVYTSTIDGSIVLNLHSMLFHRLPRLTPRLRDGCCSLAKLAVDRRTRFSFKALSVWSRYGVHEIFVYDSETRAWTQKPTPCPDAVDTEMESTYCEGVMYMKCGNASTVRPFRRLHPAPLPDPQILAYNFEHDVWTVLPVPPDGPEPPAVRPAAPRHLYGAGPRPPPRRDFGPVMRGLGEWRGVLHDLTLSEEGGLRVWEFQHGPQTWLEVDRMPTPMLEWFLIEPHPLRVFLRNRLVDKIKTCYCDQFILISRHDFAETSGLARFVLYDMDRRSWETLNVAKNWICKCTPKKRSKVDPPRPLQL